LGRERIARTGAEPPCAGGKGESAVGRALGNSGDLFVDLFGDA
jgi:hypothetical protein